MPKDIKSDSPLPVCSLSGACIKVHILNFPASAGAERLLQDR